MRIAKPTYNFLKIKYWIHILSLKKVQSKNSILMTCHIKHGFNCIPKLKKSHNENWTSQLFILEVLVEIICFTWGELFHCLKLASNILGTTRSLVLLVLMSYQINITVLYKCFCTFTTFKTLKTHKVDPNYQENFQWRGLYLGPPSWCDGHLHYS